jgi:trehalose 6-phosphate phosphatase
MGGAIDGPRGSATGKAVDLDEVIAAARTALPKLIVAVDFDGTLAPLMPDPEQSRPVSGALESLIRLADIGAQIAVITGRDALTALRLGGFDAVPGIVVAGLYGAETWTDAGLASLPTPTSMELLRERLPFALADTDPLLWIEDKRLSLVVHARRTADPVAALSAVRGAVQAAADEVGAEVHPGSDVLELRMPGYDKGGALARIAATRPGAAVLYLGDDLGDLPAFAEVTVLRAAGRVAYAVGVASSGVAEVLAAADLSVASAVEATALLSAVAQPAAR